MRVEVKLNMAEQRARKGKPQQLRALIPEAARALGFQQELELSQRALLFRELLTQIAPHLVPHCRLVGTDGGRLAVEVDDRVTAQELHLRSAELASAFSKLPNGVRVIGLTIRLGRDNNDTEHH